MDTALSDSVRLGVIEWAKKNKVDLSFEAGSELSESIVNLVARYNTDLIDLSE